MPESRRSTSPLLVLASLVLAVQVVLLALENRELEAALAELREEAPLDPDDAGAGEPRPRFATGEILDPFTLVAADGARRRVGFDGEFERLLLLVWARGCSVCPMVVPVWDGLAEELPASIAVLGIQLEPVDVERPPDPLFDDLAFAAHHLADPKEVPFEKLTTVPVTLLLDAAGLVEWVRYGALDEHAVVSLRAALGV
jgi:thiol-disulfide isomerase/thioredoxin